MRTVSGAAPSVRACVLFVRGGVRGATDRALEILELGARDGSCVDLEPGRRWNRVHRKAAADASDRQGRTRGGRKVNRGQTSSRAGRGVHGIRRAERSPRMAAGSVKRHTKAPRSERAVDDPFVAGAVERDHGVRIRAASREVVFGASQIADAFLAGRRDELDGALSADASTVDLGGEREHDRQAAAIVVDARADEPLAVAANREIGRRGETRCRGARRSRRATDRVVPARRPMTLPASSVWMSAKPQSWKRRVTQPPRSCSSPVGAAIWATAICDRTIASSRAARRACAAASARCVVAVSDAVPCGLMVFKEYCLPAGRKARADRAQQQRVPGRL